MKYLLTVIMFFFIAGPTQASLIFDLTYSSIGSTPKNPGAAGNAFGTFEIDVLAGELFTVSDLLALDITAHTTNTSTHKYLLSSLTNVVLGDLLRVSFEGVVSDDGLTVTFTDIFLKNGGTGFGCNMLKCESGGIVQTIGNDTSGDAALSDLFNYGTQDEIRNAFNVSLKSTPNIPVSEPSTLVVFALGIMGLLSRRFNKKF
ncbi:MAG: hypothetical protein ACJAYB_003526 [Psychromonas sp.]|jgi:hypothetical protein